MPSSFSKFGIWENEVREFIDSICTVTKIPKPELTKWIYSEGIMCFVQATSKSYTQDTKSYEEEHKRLPEDISVEKMSNYKKDGFMALVSEMAKEFLKEGIASESYLKKYFDSLVATAVANHIPFYSIQADFTNLLNKLLNEHPETSKEARSKFITDIFEEYKINNPTFNEEIDNHLLMGKEYLSVMKQLVVAKQESNNLHVIFKTLSPKSSGIDNQPAALPVESKHSQRVP